MARCLARVTSEDSKLYFADNKHYFYPELQCETLVKDEHQMCQRCRFKKPTRTQEARSFDHGLIGGEIPEKSHIYGSKWYYEAEKKYGKPKETESSLNMGKKVSATEINGAPEKKRRIKKSEGTSKAKAVEKTERPSSQKLAGNELIGLKYIVSFEEPLPVREIRTIALEKSRDGLWIAEDFEVERNEETGTWIRVRVEE